jgi:arylsulfatase A-like enzyme
MVHAADHPNVIIIYADDMGYGDLGCYGCKDIATPNVDQLAAEGVRFTDGYVSAPQCAPSRAGLLSGKYQNRLGFEYNTPGRLKFSHGFPRNEKTLGDLMKARGYRTGIIGKWHMGAGADLHPNRRGFDEFFGTLFGHSNFIPPYNAFSRKLKGRNEPKSDIQRNGKTVDERDYLTDAFTREAVAFIECNQEKPFFLYLPYTAPHGPLQATEKYLKRFPKIEHPKRRTYAAMVSALDDGVGAIMAKLKERKLEENTLVFFISDSGATRRTSFGDNGPLRAWKGSLHEGGIRVPFIMNWKGTLPAGVVDSRPVIQLDATATAVALAGGDVSDMDGVNLVPYLLKQKSGVRHEQLFWRIMSWAYKSTGEPWQKATRRGDWKLVLTGKTFELYNLGTDISEKNNVAAQHPRLVEELKASWNKWESTLQFPHFPADSSVFPWEKLKAEAEQSAETSRN